MMNVVGISFPFYTTLDWTFQRGESYGERIYSHALRLIKDRDRHIDYDNLAVKDSSIIILDNVICVAFTVEDSSE
jgi:hypothetical protein